MAAKRYDPPKQRMSIRRARSIKGAGGSAGGAGGGVPSKVKLPRAASVVPMEEDEGATMPTDAAAPPGPPIGLSSTGASLSGYPPHEMRYLTYKHARWSLRVRKEVMEIFIRLNSSK